MQYSFIIFIRPENTYKIKKTARWRVWRVRTSLLLNMKQNCLNLLFLQKLNGLNSFEDIYEWMGDKQATRNLAEKLLLPEEKIKEVYIMLIVFTHGIATMIATGGANISDGESSAILEKAYNAFVKAQK